MLQAHPIQTTLPPIKLDSLHLMETFLRVCETGSFTAAARLLEVSPSALSKAVARLEETLGARLIRRTTRRLSLTEEGQLFMETCRQVLADIEDVEMKLTQGRSMPSGRLRIQASVAFGRIVIVPLLLELLGTNPDLRIDLDLSDRAVSLFDGQYDAAVRVGGTIDDKLIARKLGHIAMVTVASPTYLERHGTPRIPADLRHHQCYGYFIPEAASYREWSFAGGHSLAAPHGGLNVNNAQALVEVAVSGHGIVNIAALIAFDALQAGAVKPVLAEYSTDGPPVYLVYSERRYQPQRMRTLVNFLSKRICADVRWQRIGC